MHAYLIAVVPPAIPAAATEKFIAGLMERYNENIEVPGYDAPCECIGSVATDECVDATDKKFPSWTDLRASHNSDTDPPWHEYIKPRVDYQNAQEAAHPGMKDPDPNCRVCKGGGTEKQTHNPEGRWDWYRIGGRWDGVVKKVERPSEDNGFNFAPEHQQLEHNSILCSEALKTWDVLEDTPYSILTSAGEWMEKPMEAYDDDTVLEAWRMKVHNFLKDHPDHILVGLDYH